VFGTRPTSKKLTVAVVEGHPTQLKDVARVERGPEPVFNIVTAEGVNAVLLNIRSQPDGSTLNIKRQLDDGLAELKRELPPDVKLRSSTTSRSSCASRSAVCGKRSSSD